MTEFTAALLTGLIGLIGAGIGASATAWAAKISASKNIEAARGQAQDQAENEHAHWLRQQRLAACEGFLDAWDECTRYRKELTLKADDNLHNALRADLRRSASLMLERARRISLLGPEGVSSAAETISKATLENVSKEDEFGQYVKQALRQIKEQERQIRDQTPDLPSEEFLQVLRNAGDLKKLQELYSIHQLEGIIEKAETRHREVEEYHRRLGILAEMAREFNEEGARFIEAFKHNIQVSEETRVTFLRTVRSAITGPPARND
ncbi:hypothetical protein ACWEV4_10060 [Streptomyces sp. NPDC003860]